MLQLARYLLTTYLHHSKLTLTVYSELILFIWIRLSIDSFIGSLCNAPSCIVPAPVYSISKNQKHDRYSKKFSYPLLICNSLFSVNCVLGSFLNYSHDWSFLSFPSLKYLIFNCNDLSLGLYLHLNILNSFFSFFRVFSLFLKVVTFDKMNVTYCFS